MILDPRRSSSGPAALARGRAVLAVALATTILLAACGSTTAPETTPSSTTNGVVPTRATPTPDTTSTTIPTPTPSPTPPPAPTPSPTPTPAPTPVLAVAPLTGRLVKPELAARHPIIVMVDDHWDARPQSGFTEASVVWQAPAEGGIPRYMLVFAEGNPKSVGPVRSARLYFVQWASEWRAVYVHAGGSPQAKAILAAKGRGQLVYNADEFRWGGRYLWRTTDRFAPHNVYTDGKHLRALAKRLGAKPIDAKPVWKFAPDAPLEARPAGAKISFAYRYNKIAYKYDRETNTWLRYVGGKLQRDRANKKVVAPQNVVIMKVRFGLLGAGQKGRLEAANIGSGPAVFATNGVISKGTWRKKSASSPTKFYDARGKPVVLTVGQTFVQVVPTGTTLKLVKGTPVGDPSPSPTQATP
jgi:hypothetical protein